MDGKVKIIIGVAAVAMIGMVGYSKLSASLNKDPAVTSIQAEFVGEVSPGENFTKSMFNVKGVTETGKLVKLNDFSSKTTAAAQNGDSCEVEITSQGQSATAIVNITREPVFEQNIGYPNEEDATVTCYSNGDLEFEGKGELTNFGTSLPWKDCEYTHVYIDETLQIESMDSWFEGNENLVYCTNIPKSVKTMKKTFANCKALEKAPDYFQCSNLKIMDYAFSGCEALKEIENLLCLDDKNTIEYKEYKNDYTTLTDSQLNEVYSAILDIPELKLNSDHIESLKKRGLTESEIDIFGYRTMPEYLYFPKGKDWSFKLWDRSNFEDIYFRFLNLKK